MLRSPFLTKMDVAYAWVAPRLAPYGGQQDLLATLSCLTVPSFSEVPRLGQAPGGLSDAANKIVLIDGPVVFKNMYS